MKQSNKAEILKELNRPIIKSGRGGTLALPSPVSVTTILNACMLAILVGMALGVFTSGGRF